MTIVSARPQATSRRVPEFGTEFRTDLQGLRAVAVLLVLSFHAGVPFFSGGYVGVDVFFVLSGYLITGIMARELRQSGRVSLPLFYSRRIVRIVPAATVVLVTTLGAALIWLPSTQWRPIAEQVIGSALYISNWQFAGSADYLNAEAAPSPLQHFWSLAVEEQYYLFWPALLVMALVLLRIQIIPSRREIDPVKVATIVMVIITVASLSWSLIALDFWPEAAYFLTQVRIWELGIGSLLALLVPRLRGLPSWLKLLMQWGGLAAILCAGALYDRTTVFPGATALLPVLGAASVIAGGLSSSDTTRKNVLLGNPLMVWVGSVSYSLYLWHWPVLVIGLYLVGESSLPLALILVAVAFVPAYLSTRFIEKPIQRRWRDRGLPRSAFLLGALCLIVSLLAATAVLFSLRDLDNVSKETNAHGLGAASIAQGADVPRIEQVPLNLHPSLLEVSGDNPAIYEDACHLEVSETEPRECAYGDPTGETLLLAGDSHAAQWFPALEQLAVDHGFRLVTMTKSSCPFADVTVELTGKNRSYSECAEWNANVRSYIDAERPTAVFTGTLGSYVTTESSARETLKDGLHRTWEWTAATGSLVFPLVDTPYMAENIPDCLARRGNSPAECSTERDKAFMHPGLEIDAAADLPDVAVLDLNDKICPGSFCEPIIGDVIVFRDQHHLSATYAKSLSTALTERSLPLLNSKDNE